MKPHEHFGLYKPRISSTETLLPSYHIGLRSQGQLQNFKCISQLGSYLLPLLRHSQSQLSLLLSTLVSKSSTVSDLFFSFPQSQHPTLTICKRLDFWSYVFCLPVHSLNLLIYSKECLLLGALMGMPPRAHREDQFARGSRFNILGTLRAVMIWRSW